MQHVTIMWKNVSELDINKTRMEEYVEGRRHDEKAFPRRMNDKEFPPKIFI